MLSQDYTHFRSELARDLKEESPASRLVSYTNYLTAMCLRESGVDCIITVELNDETPPA
jgi:hypothetical protein